METEFKMEVLCLFCQQPFQINKNEEVKAGGGLIKCKSCGELNDSDSLIETTKERSMEKTKKEAVEHLNKSIKDIFK